MKNILTINILPLAPFFMIAFCSAYITQLTAFSPFYFAYFLALIICLINIISKVSIPDLKSNNFTLLITLIIFFYYVIANCFWKQPNKLSYYFITILFNQFSLVITFYSLRINNQLNIKKMLIGYFYVSLFIGIWDFINRYINATNTFKGVLFFYNYKLSSIMFTDSNWVGFIYMIAFSFFIYIRERYGWIKRKIIFLFFILVCLSFSRAAIISCVLIIFFNFIKKQQRSIRSFFLFLVCVCIFFSPFIIQFLLNDDSFGTKMALLRGLDYYLHTASLTQLLFGNGMGVSSSDLALPLLGGIGYGGHLYLILKIIDTGIVGLILELIFFLNIALITNGYFIYLFLPFFVCGLSMCPGNLSFMYVFGGLMMYLEGYKKTDGDNIWN